MAKQHTGDYRTEAQLAHRRNATEDNGKNDLVDYLLIKRFGFVLLPTKNFIFQYNYINYRINT